MIYQAGLLKRNRATKAEMEARAHFLIDYAKCNAPVTVRQLFYAATIRGLIDKTEGGYNKVQAQVLALRRDGRLPYRYIADATRYMRKPTTHDSIYSALEDTALLYRKALWADSDIAVEIWIEKSALAGVIYPVTEDYDVPLMPTGGYTSETFAHGAVSAMQGRNKTLVIYSLYDFDRSGRDAQNSLEEKVMRFGHQLGVDVQFYPLGLTADQVRAMELPTRPHKRASMADKAWPHPFAAELDAIPPDVLRDMVRSAIERHLPAHELDHLKRVERAERETLMQFVTYAKQGRA